MISPFHEMSFEARRRSLGAGMSRTGCLTHLLLASLFAILAAGCGSPTEAGPGKDDPIVPEPEPEPDPAWEGLGIRKELQWRSFGEVSRLATGPFGADGSPLTLVAGRELLAFSEKGDALWRSLWGRSIHGSLAVAMAVVEGESGQPARVLITNDVGDAQLFEPATGRSIWQTSLDLAFPEPIVTTFGARDDPVFLPEFGRFAYKVSSGAKLWKVPLPAVPAWVVTARRGPDAPTIAFAAIARERGTNVSRPDTFAVSAAGKILFEFASPSFVTAVAAADLDGEGSDSLLVGAPEGRLFALDPSGAPRWDRSWDLGAEASPSTTYIEQLIRWEQGGLDGRDAILLTVRDFNLPELTRLVALDADGKELWAMELGDMASQFKLGKVEEGELLLLALGVRLPMVPSAILAVDLRPTAQNRMLWRFDSSFGISDLEIVSSPKGARVLAGTAGGQLLTLHPMTGATIDERFLGFFGSAAFDVRDGLIVAGDLAGEVSLFDREGKRLWHRSLAPGGPGRVSQARLFPLGDELGIAAIGQSYTQSHLPGTLEILSKEGASLLERQLDAPPIAIEVADLDGDDRMEISLGLLHPAGCRVVTHDPVDGRVRWSADLPRCANLSVAAGDTDGDGLPELAVTGFSQDHGSFVALLGGDGEVRWLHKVRDVPVWAMPTEGAVFVAGAARESNGMVERRSVKDGTIEWSTTMAGRPRLDDPREMMKGYIAHASLAAPTGDGPQTIVVTTEEGSIASLDGRDGSILWAIRYGEDDPEREPTAFGGPVAYVPASEAFPGWILASQRTASPIHTKALAISLDGEVLGSFEIEGTTGSVVPSKSMSGAPAAFVASQLGFSSYSVHEEEPEDGQP